MLLHCKRSCKACGDGKCRDADKKCPQWAAEGACSTDVYKMFDTCPKSCNQCGELFSSVSAPLARGVLLGRVARGGSALGEGC